MRKNVICLTLRAMLLALCSPATVARLGEQLAERL